MSLKELMPWTSSPALAHRMVSLASRPSLALFAAVIGLSAEANAYTFSLHNTDTQPVEVAVAYGTDLKGRTFTHAGERSMDGLVTIQPGETKVLFHYWHWLYTAWLAIRTTDDGAVWQPTDRQTFDVSAANVQCRYQCSVRPFPGFRSEVLLTNALRGVVLDEHRSLHFAQVASPVRDQNITFTWVPQQHQPEPPKPQPEPPQPVPPQPEPPQPVPPQPEPPQPVPPQPVPPQPEPPQPAPPQPAPPQPVPPQPAPPQPEPPQPQHLITVCNRTPQAIHVAFGYFKEDAKAWVSAGWYQVDEATCRQPLQQINGAIYGYATDDTKSTSGTFWLPSNKEASFCLDSLNTYLLPYSACLDGTHANYRIQTFGQIETDRNGGAIWDIKP